MSKKKKSFTRLAGSGSTVVKHSEVKGLNPATSTPGRKWKDKKVL
jgi:hypothetical protein